MFDARSMTTIYHTSYGVNLHRASWIKHLGEWREILFRGKVCGNDTSRYFLWNQLIFFGIVKNMMPKILYLNSIKEIDDCKFDH
jgi:hypothetical protein